MKADYRSTLALFYVLLICSSSSYGLQGGPQQPDYAQFEPVDATNMVNYLNGNFVYSLPLVTLEGSAGSWPISIAYHGGIKHDQEASWVGLGWILNPGAINRVAKGYPDDYLNAEVNSHYYDYLTDEGWGVWASFSYNGIIGLGVGYDSDVGFSPSLSAGVSISSGYLSASVGFSLGRQGGNVTAGIGVGGINAAISPSGTGWALSSASLSIPGTGVTFGSEGITYQGGSIRQTTTQRSQAELQGSTTRGNTSSGVTIPIPTKVGTFFVGFGSYSWWHKYILDETITETGNGYLAQGGEPFTLQTGSTSPRSLGSEYVSYAKLDAYESSNHELFPAQDDYMVEAQGLVGAFKPYAAYATKLRNWANTRHVRNSYWGTTANLAASPSEHSAQPYFEEGVTAANARISIRETLNRRNRLMSLRLKDLYANDVSNAAKYYQNSSIHFVFANDPGGNVMTTPAPDGEVDYSKALPEQSINSRQAKISSVGGVTQVRYGSKIVLPIYTEVPKSIGATEKTKVLSGFKIFDVDGKVYYFTTPVYSFGEVAYTTNQSVGFTKTPAATSGTKQSYLEKKTPYATSWLLTAVVGPDYVDWDANNPLLGNEYNPKFGPSDDDMGFWVKFTYDKPTSYSNPLKDVKYYGWRTPTIKDGAVEKNMLTDAQYNRGLGKYIDVYSASYGVREVVYLTKIETNLQRAEFTTAERKDGRGYGKAITDLFGTGVVTGYNKSKLLDRIDIYSKVTGAKIKAVDFRYSYGLCGGTPNSIAGPGDGDAQYMRQSVAGGKLTLREVDVTGGGGLVHFPHVFHYEGQNPRYDEPHKMQPVFNRLCELSKDIPTVPHDPAKSPYVRDESMAVDAWGFYNPFALTPGSEAYCVYPYSYGIEKNFTRTAIGDYGLNVGGDCMLNQLDRATSYNPALRGSWEEELEDTLRSLRSYDMSQAGVCWNMTKITTPLGGSIEVEYERDRYYAHLPLAITHDPAKYAEMQSGYFLTSIESPPDQASATYYENFHYFYNEDKPPKQVRDSRGIAWEELGGDWWRIQNSEPTGPGGTPKALGGHAASLSGPYLPPTRLPPGFGDPVIVPGVNLPGNYERLPILYMPQGMPDGYPVNLNHDVCFGLNDNEPRVRDFIRKHYNKSFPCVFNYTLTYDFPNRGEEYFDLAYAKMVQMRHLCRAAVVRRPFQGRSAKNISGDALFDGGQPYVLCVPLGRELRINPNLGVHDQGVKVAEVNQVYALDHPSMKRLIWGGDTRVKAINLSDGVGEESQISLEYDIGTVGDQDPYMDAQLHRSFYADENPSPPCPETGHYAYHCNVGAKSSGSFEQSFSHLRPGGPVMYPRVRVATTRYDATRDGATVPYPAGITEYRFWTYDSKIAGKPLVSVSWNYKSYVEGNWDVEKNIAIEDYSSLVGEPQAIRKYRFNKTDMFHAGATTAARKLSELDYTKGKVVEETLYEYAFSNGVTMTGAATANPSTYIAAATVLLPGHGHGGSAPQGFGRLSNTSQLPVGQKTEEWEYDNDYLKFEVRANAGYGEVVNEYLKYFSDNILYDDLPLGDINLGTRPTQLPEYSSTQHTIDNFVQRIRVGSSKHNRYALYPWQTITRTDNVAQVTNFSCIDVFTGVPLATRRLNSDGTAKVDVSIPAYYLATHPSASTAGSAYAPYEEMYNRNMLTQEHVNNVWVNATTVGQDAYWNAMNEFSGNVSKLKASTATLWSLFNGTQVYKSSVRALRVDDISTQVPISSDLSSYSKSMWVGPQNTKFDRFGHAIEEVIQRSPEDFTYSRAVMGHRSSRATAIIQNAKRDECGAYTCDYDVGHAQWLDDVNGWGRGAGKVQEGQMPPGTPSVSVIAAAKRFGHRCVKVTSAWGPSCNFRLERGSNYELSAWIRVADGSKSPPFSKGIVMGADYRKRLSGTSVGDFPIDVEPRPRGSGGPAFTGVLTIGEDVGGWKLVKMSVPAKTDISEGEWNQGYQYIRIWVGCPAGDGSGSDATLYIDDIRFYPTDALVTTYHYDPDRLTLAAMVDPNNKARSFAYDDIDRLTEIRNSAGLLVKEYSYAVATTTLSNFLSSLAFPAGVSWVWGYHPLEWAPWSGEKAKVELSIDGGNTWSTLRSAMPNAGYYLWHPTAYVAPFDQSRNVAPSENCRLRVTLLDETGSPIEGASAETGTFELRKGHDFIRRYR